jgi:hypothetical protein
MVALSPKPMFLLAPNFYVIKFNDGREFSRFMTISR